MASPKAIGAIELSSVAFGYQVEDDMLKAADVELLIARTICSGKYLIIVGGSVANVEAAVSVGLARGEGAIIDSSLIPNVDDSVFPAIGQSVVIDSDETGALGVVETFSGTSIIAAADAAAKAARVKLFRIHVAMALGGKGLCLMTGSISDVTAGVDVAAQEAANRGLLVSKAVIAKPSRELLSEYL